MVLSGQQFAEIVGYLREKASVAPAGSEKRRASRMEIKSRLVIVPIQNGAAGEQIGVLTRDISLEGIGLLSTVAIANGQPFIALLPRSDKDTILVLTQSLYCGIVADGIFALGCRFVKVLPKETMQKLQASNQAAIERIRESVLK